MRSTEVARIVDVSPQTIRLWSDRYAEFLSPSAKPERGEIRDFTEDDVRVLLTIKRESDRRLTFEELVEILKSGDRVEEIPDPVEVEEDVPVSEHAMALAKITALQRELNTIREQHNREVDRLFEEIKELKTDRDEALEEVGKREQMISDMRHRIGYLEGQVNGSDRDEALEELGKREQTIADLRHQIGYLEGQIEQLKERLDEVNTPRRRGLFGD